MLFGFQYKLRERQKIAFPNLQKLRTPQTENIQTHSLVTKMELFPSKQTSILGIPGENPTEISKTYTEPSRGNISISYSHLKSLCWLERVESNEHYEQPLAKVRSSSRWTFNRQILTAFRTGCWNKGFTEVSESGPRAALEVVYLRLLCSISTHTFALHRCCNHFGFGLTKYTRKALLCNT